MIGTLNQIVVIQNVQRDDDGDSDKCHDDVVVVVVEVLLDVLETSFLQCPIVLQTLINESIWRTAQRR